MDTLRTHKLFWLLQVSGWIAYYIIYTAIATMFRKWNLEDLLLYSLTYLLGFTITSLIRYPYQYLYSKIERLLWIPLVIVLGSVLATIAWTYIDMYVSHFFWDNGEKVLKERLAFRMFLRYSILFTILLTAWSSLYFGIKYALDWQTEKQHSREAEMMAQKAQMEMLRYQLNPHFLFNSLNSIRALVDENQKHAKEMITELSEFLRYSLLHKDALFVTLAEELEAVKHYFSIEKKRFEENLHIEYHVADATMKHQIMSFLLHPLIENAVKYGMKTSPMPLKISITVQKTGYGLLLEVCNSGSWVEKNSTDTVGTGTGLTNVQKRLENAYHDGYRLEVIKNEDNCCVRIEIKEAYLYG